MLFPYQPCGRYIRRALIGPFVDASKERRWISRPSFRRLEIAGQLVLVDRQVFALEATIDGLAARRGTCGRRRHVDSIRRERRDELVDQI